MEFLVMYQIFRLLQVIGSFLVIGLVSRELTSNSINVWLLMGTFINLGNYIDLDIAGRSITAVKAVNTKSEEIRNFAYWNSILIQSKKFVTAALCSVIVALYFYKRVAALSESNLILSFFTIVFVAAVTIIGSILSSYFIAMGLSQSFTFISLVGVVLQLMIAIFLSIKNCSFLTFIMLLAVPNVYVLSLLGKRFYKYYQNKRNEGEELLECYQVSIEKNVASLFQILQLLIMLSSLIFPLFISYRYTVSDSNAFQILFKIAFLAASVSGIHLPNIWTSPNNNWAKKGRSNRAPRTSSGIKKLFIPILMFVSLPILYLFDFLPKEKYSAPKFEEFVLWILISWVQYYLAKSYFICLAQERLKAIFLPTSIPLIVVIFCVVLSSTSMPNPVFLVFISQFLQAIYYRSIFAFEGYRKSGSHSI